MIKQSKIISAAIGCGLLGLATLGLAPVASAKVLYDGKCPVGDEVCEKRYFDHCVNSAGGDYLDIFPDGTVQCITDDTPDGTGAGGVAGPPASSTPGGGSHSSGTAPGSTGSKSRASDGASASGGHVGRDQTGS